ncbi:MAG TPA: hypothetical protein VF548_16785 [Allosphingosinicella sp.]|jgi:hypothetical protein
MKVGLAAAIALTFLAASPGRAQEATGTNEILAQMPKVLGGAAVSKLPEDIWMYFLQGPSGEPVIVGVTVAEEGGVYSPAEMRSLSRKMVAGKSRLRQIIREGTFSAPKWPGAPAFFGDYQARKDFHQNWLLLTGQRTIIVLTTYDKKTDAKWAEALVAREIFGGAVIGADKPAE